MWFGLIGPGISLYPIFFLGKGIYFIYISNAIPKVPHTLPHPPTPTSWPWRSPVLRHIKFARLMGLSFHWWPTRPFSDSYAARDTSSRGVLVSSYCSSTYRISISNVYIFISNFLNFSLLSPFPFRISVLCLLLFCSFASACLFVLSPGQDWSCFLNSNIFYSF